MVARAEFYRVPPFFKVRGGAGIDIRLRGSRVRPTTFDGKVTSVTRLGALSLEGWSNFRGSLRPKGSTTAKVVSIVVDGNAADGTLRIRATKEQTWDLQQQGIRGGQLTVIGRNPALQDLELVTLNWRLLPGSTAPNAPVATDWTVLR